MGGLAERALAEDVEEQGARLTLEACYNYPAASPKMKRLSTSSGTSAAEHSARRIGLNKSWDRMTLMKFAGVSSASTFCR